MKIFTVTFLLLTFSLSDLFAQAEPDTISVILDEARIEASRLTEGARQAPFAFSLSRISEDRRITSPAPTLAAPLQGIPGLWVNDRHNHALGERISVRGMGWRASFGVRGVFIMLDGVPLTMPDGQAIMSLVDPSFIHETELIRGPAASFWGNAGGGALILSTSPASPSAEPMVRTRFTTGSFGYYKTDIETQFGVGSNRYTLYGSQFFQDGFRDHSRFEAWRFGGHADINTGSESRLRLTGVFLESPVSDNPGSLAFEQSQNEPDASNPNNVNQQAGKLTTHGQIGADYVHAVGDGLLRLQTWGLYRNLRNPLAFAWIQVNRTAGGIRTGYSVERSDFEWSVGVDASLQSDRRRNWVNDGGDRGNLTLSQLEQVTSTGAFGRIRIPIDRLSFSFGLRADLLYFENNDRMPDSGDDTSGNRTFNALSPMAGISYDFGSATAWLNFSSGFETPTTTELVNRPDMTGGFNPDLQPERYYGFETGLRGQFDDWGLLYDLAVYRMYVNDLLLPFRTEEGGDRDFYQNAGATLHDGFEAQVQWIANRIFNTTLSYTRNFFRFNNEALTVNGESVEGNRLPGIPDHRFSGIAEITLSPVQLRLDGEVSSSYYVNNQNSEKNPAYAVLNANISVIDWSPTPQLRITPFFQINNIFDERYNSSVIINAFGGRYYEPAPGRHFMGGVSVRFN